MPAIKTAVTTGGAKGAAAATRLYFEITNEGKEDVYVLKRDTPLEGLKTDCLEVKVNGEPVLYDGYFFKRAAPGKEDYLLLHAGESLSAPFDLSQAYDTSLPGVYEVRFNESKLVVMPAGAQEEGVSAESHGATDMALENTGDRFAIGEAQPAPTTVGATQRAKNKKKERVKAFAEAAALQQPEITGGNEAQKKIVTAAHQAGYALTAGTLTGLDDLRHYNLWFGAASSERENMVLENYGKMKQGMETKDFTYHASGPECGQNDFAYSVQDGTDIWLCIKFWQAPARGMNSQAGTVVHEHSHTSAFAEDVEVNGEKVYGEEASKKLAASEPDKAIRNADNYEFFAESLPPSPEGFTASVDLQHLTESLNVGDDVAALAETEGFLEEVTCNQNPRPWRNWRVAEALKTLLRQVNAFAPTRSRTHDGTIGDTDHQSRVSDHNPWVLDPASRLGVVTALDVTHDPVHNCDCHQLAQLLQRHKDKRIKYVIWNRRIINSAPINGTEAWQWRNYSGANPHDKHMHVSVKCDAGSFDANDPWALFAL